MLGTSRIATQAESNNTFPGFATGKEICNVLNKPHNVELKSFVTRFFQQVSEANQAGRQEQYVAKDRKFFDALAQILTGNEVCAAVAISDSSELASEPEILIATNVGSHDQRAFSYGLDLTILEKSPSTNTLRLGFRCHLRSQDATVVSKEIGPLEYQFHIQSGKALLQDPKLLIFRFSINEFPYLPDDEVGVNLSTYKELQSDFFFGLMNRDEGTVIPLQEPIIICRGSLRRRVAKLFNHLSFIANPILRKLPMLPEYCKPECVNYSQFIEGEYQHYIKQSTQQCHEDEFIGIIREKSPKHFQFDQEGRDSLESFLSAAREHYQAANLKDQTALYLEQHMQWPNILNDSLTYELSRGIFAKDISLTSKPPKGSLELGQLYVELIQSYIQYKIQHWLQSSVPSVISWFDSLREQHHLNLPPFIQPHFMDFHTVARRYFIQLAVIEEYIKENAAQNGILAQRIARENIFKSSSVKLVQGTEGVHAEMRLFSHHLLEGRHPAKYYGIAKLCCTLCYYTLSQFRASGFHPPETRGTHATLYRWPLPEAFYRDQYMQVLLGSGLFEKYTQLNHEHRLQTLIKGPFYSLQEVIRDIISKLDRINSDNTLNQLGISPDLQIPGSADHYPDNQMLPRLPSSHPDVAVEKSLKESERTYGPKDSILFEPLATLGRIWRAEKNNHNTYCYLSRAVEIFDQFPSSIDPLRASQVLNLLGNVCIDLKLYDKASGYLMRALDLKKTSQAETNEIAITLINLGRLHHDRGDLYQARLALGEALQYATDARYISIIKRNLAIIDKSYI
ncbi:MAG: hypothetical protein ACHQUC_05880 [Chlamydiales bacterium]